MNSVFLNGIEWLCVVILHLFFPRVKLFLHNCQVNLEMLSFYQSRNVLFIRPWIL
jgi:hypothetical protein